MTDQEIFDRILTHLRTQGKAAAIVDGRCMYRARDTDGTVLKCAVGCLIDDRHYNPEIEGRSVSYDRVERVLSASLGLERLPPSTTDLLRQCQGAHDSVLLDHDVAAWELRMRDIAEAHNLIYTKPA